MTGTQNTFSSYHRAVLGGKRCATAALMCLAASLPLSVSAQDSIAMVDASAMANVAPVATTSVINSSAITSSVATEGVVDAQASTVSETTKSPITGLEPGTLALIGFGLIALAATRRNAR